jgi:hypothetical protein
MSVSETNSRKAAAVDEKKKCQSEFDFIVHGALTRTILPSRCHINTETGLKLAKKSESRRCYPAVLYISGESRALSFTTAKPTRDATLGLGSAALDLLVKVVHLLYSVGSCLLGIGFGVALCSRELLVRFRDLFVCAISRQSSRPRW